MDVWYSSLKGLVRLYMALFIKRIEIKGRENIPDGPKIIVGNHSYISDGFALPFIIKEKLHFVIQAETFRLRLIGRWLALADQIPVILGQGRDMLKSARQRLEWGHSVVIFPEGWLNLGLAFHRAGAGAALLAAQTGVPVLPVGFYVPPEFVRVFRPRMFNHPTAGGWQFGGPLFVSFGEPIHAMSGGDDAPQYHYLRRFTDQIMQSVNRLVQDIRGESVQHAF
jgi:1-acyl-sn-glycerol-3-phosphate acyltransferase